MNRGAWLIAVVAMTVGVACGGGGPRARGFGSRQIYASSDPTLQLSYWIDAGLMFSLGDPAAPGSKLVVDPETGQVTPAPENPFGAPPPKARFECTYEADGTTTLTDAQTGVKTPIEGSATCPTTPEDSITVVRLSASGELTIWRGPYDRLERIALGLKLRNVGNYAGSTLVVLAAPEADPEAVGLYSVGPGPSDVTEIIPGHLTSAAVAAGGTFVGELSSSRLSRSMLGFGYEFAGVYDQKGHFIYARVMSDGREVYFVGPFETGPRELAIAPVPVERVVGGVNFGHAYPPAPIHWIERVGDRVALRVWDGEGRRLVSCDWLGGAGRWLAGARGIMVGGAPDGDQGARTGLMLMHFDRAADGGACVPLELSGVVSAGISFTGKTIYWIGVASPTEWGLWVADGDGGNPRMVRTSAFMKDPVFLSETRLQLKLNDDLVWVDLSQPDLKVHYVAEKTFGSPIDFGVSKVITIYDYSAQDDTGTVGICERDTGAKRFISASVSGSGGLAWGSFADHPDGQLAYVVRGRNPSSQDGIWLATFSGEDLR